ncbi:sister chromatid cohesion protein SCC4 isoform X2 [Magnolia sinica]|uniref:sister chromatid cohesion protein SCC4 isoform X2 n=1 Tax=Magnolia sinica TaxID=86752 RepID=UPI00265B5EB3|nr:sister chromatid cohesion protein SCC4 isoform X2 [Magnolia sinica]
MEMEALAEGLWGLADFHESNGEIGKAIKCLEAICQSHVSFLPIVEIKTRLRIATILLKHTHNVNHAKSHLERSQLLLKSIPSCFELKCRAYSLLSQCYHLVGAIPQQKQILNKGLEMTASSQDGFEVKLWSCNFNSQLANALVIEGDYRGSISALEHGYMCATEIGYPELQMFFATSMLHVHLMQWEDVSLVDKAVEKCNSIWESIQTDRRQQCLGLFFYSELLHTFYRLRTCDYKSAAQHVDKLDAAMKDSLQQDQRIQELTSEIDAITQSLSQADLPRRQKSALNEKLSQLQEQLKTVSGLNLAGKEPSYFGNARQTWGNNLELAPPPVDGEWLPKSAVYALVDLMVVIFGRPKGLFKECGRRIQSGLHVIQDELVKLGITDGIREVDLQHSAIWMAGVYLMLLMQFLENKVAVELTRSEFVEAQELTESKSMQAMCQVYAAVSYICIGDVESSSRALDLIGPVYRIMDSFVGVREKTSVLFAYGLLLMKQHNLQEARIRLATGLRITHQHLGNIQLVSQYLTILGTLALALHDTGQAREILKSSLTLAKTLYDIPTQIWVLSVLTALYQELGERGNEMENLEYERKKADDLQKRLSDARSSIHHLELIDKSRIQVKQLHELDIKRAVAGPSTKVNLDIPESVGLSTPSPALTSARLCDIDTGRRGKKKI